MSFDCPSPERLLALLHGDEALPADLDEHLALCPSCRKSLDELSGAETIQVPRDLASKVSNADIKTCIDQLPRVPSITPGLIPSGLLAAAPPGSDCLGLLGPFEVEGVLAVGGMGVVLEGRDPVLERAVAIKIPSAKLAGDAAARERFLREARSVAAVDHPNVLPIFAVDTHPGSGLPYLVMPRVVGESLQDLIDREAPLDPVRTRKILAGIAAGLEAAHKKGIIHRDLKPSNILLDHDQERLWIADFGLARSLDAPGHTQADVIAGTPEYMAPEQIEGRDLDQRADLFSLGGILYAMATGHSPFQKASTVATLHAVTHEAPRNIQDFRDNYPADLSKLSSLLLTKDRSLRPDSAEEIGALLDGSRTARSQRSRWPLIALVVFAVLCLPLLLLLPFGEAKKQDADAQARLLAAFASTEQTSNLHFSQDVRLKIEQLSLKNRRLRISAEPGAEVILEFITARSTISLQEATLELDGIALQIPQHIARAERPMIEVMRSRLELHDCQVSTEAESVFFQLTRSSDLVMQDSLVQAPNASMMAYSGQGTDWNVTAVISNCLLRSEYVLRGRGHGRVWLDVADSLAVCSRSIIFKREGSAPLALEFNRSTLVAADALLAADVNPRVLRQGLRWTGDHNRYASRVALLRGVINDGTTIPANLEDWRRVTGDSGEASRFIDLPVVLNPLVEPAYAEFLPPGWQE